MNLRFHLRPDRVAPDGSYPIVLRITLHKQRAVRDTELRATKKQWDQKGQTLRGSSAAARDGNVYLTELKVKAQNAYFTLLREQRPGRPATAANVKALMDGGQTTAPPTVLELSTKWLEYQSRPAMGNEPNTIRSFVTRAKALEDYIRGPLRKPGLLGLEVVERTAQAYTDYLLDQHYDPKTVRRYVAWLKQVMRFAKKQDYVPSNELTDFRCAIRSVTPVPIYLPAHEVELLWKTPFPDDYLTRTADAWLFCCETGLSFADYQQFDASLHLHEDDRGVHWIRMVRRKMRKRKPEGFSVPLSPRARQILERYRYQLPNINNSNGNRYLKEIMQMLAIETHLTWKVARSTFAQRWVDKGVDFDTIAEMMGDVKGVVKEHYARIREENISAKVVPLLQQDSEPAHYTLSPTGWRTGSTG